MFKVHGFPVGFSKTLVNWTLQGQSVKEEGKPPGMSAIICRSIMHDCKLW